MRLGVYTVAEANIDFQNLQTFHVFLQRQLPVNAQMHRHLCVVVHAACDQHALLVRRVQGRAHATHPPSMQNPKRKTSSDFIDDLHE